MLNSRSSTKRESSSQGKRLRSTNQGGMDYFEQLNKLYIPLSTKIPKDLIYNAQTLVVPNSCAEKPRKKKKAKKTGGQTLVYYPDSYDHPIRMSTQSERASSVLISGQPSGPNQAFARIEEKMDYEGDQDETEEAKTQIDLERKDQTIELTPKKPPPTQHVRSESTQPKKQITKRLDSARSRKSILCPVRTQSRTLIAPSLEADLQDFHPVAQQAISNGGSDPEDAQIQPSAVKVMQHLPAIMSVQKPIDWGDAEPKSARQNSPQLLQNSSHLHSSSVLRSHNSQRHLHGDRESLHSIRRVTSRQKNLSPLANPPLVKQEDQPARYKPRPDKSPVQQPTARLRPINMAQPTRTQQSGEKVRVKSEIPQTDRPENTIEPSSPKQTNEKVDKNQTIEVKDKTPGRQRPVQVFESGTQSIYCQSLNAEPFIRRAVQKLGWQEIGKSSKPNQFCHVRFDISDFEGACQDLKAWQFYNHHPSNREITTKAGLCKNLQSNFDEYQLQVSSFFPRCYDLADTKQIQEFVTDFNQTCCMAIITLSVKSFVGRGPELKELMLEYEQKIGLFAQPRVFKLQFKQKCQRFDPSQPKPMAENEPLRLAYQYAKALLRQQSLQDKPSQKPKRSLEEAAPILHQYHKQLLSNKPQAAFPPMYEQFKLLRLLLRCQQAMPQLEQIDGYHNLWIVKPSYNARGVGIYCTNLLNEIVTTGKGQTQQQKVVQKYIERPMLLQDKKSFWRRKFDFRQWVLVMQWEPLEVYVFDGCYLKICGAEFDLGYSEDVLRHLSNYSLQKGPNKKELVMSSEEFEQYMAQALGRKWLWKEDMLPQIHSVVFRCLKSLQETQEQRQASFEIYGFDIVLDEELRPWVIEINLSPACQERQPWLTKMLDDSATDLLAHIHQKVLTSMPLDYWNPRLKAEALAAQKQLKDQRRSLWLNSEEFYQTQSVKNRWQRIHECFQEQREWAQTIFLQSALQPCDFQLQVTKADLKWERKIEKSGQQESSANKIQTWWRVQNAKKVARNIVENNASILMQKHARRWLARQELLRLKRQKAAIFIQKFARMFNAKSELRYLRLCDIVRRKRKIAVKIQSLFRRKKAQRRCATIRKNNAAVKIQQFLRGYRCRQQTLSTRNFRCRVIYLQRFFRNRFKSKQKASICVQKYLKGFIERRKTLRQLPLLKAVQSSNLIRIKFLKKTAFIVMKQHRAAIFLQACLRRHQARILVQKLKTKKALQRLQFVAGKYKLRQKIRFLKEFSQKYKQNCIFVQKFLRGFLANKRKTQLREMRRLVEEQRQIRKQKTDASIKIQKHLRGQLARKRVQWMKVEDGAACFIQSWWRGFKCRQQLARTKKATRNPKPRAKPTTPQQYSKFVKQIKKELKQMHKSNQQRDEKVKQQKRMRLQQRPADQILQNMNQSKPEIFQRFKKDQAVKGDFQIPTHQSQVETISTNQVFMPAETQDKVVVAADQHYQEHMSQPNLRGPQSKSKVVATTAMHGQKPTQTKSKSFAQSLHEMLESQKAASQQRVAQLMMHEKEAVQSKEERRMNPYLQQQASRLEASFASSSQKKSAFAESLQQTQEKLREEHKIRDTYQQAQSLLRKQTQQVVKQLEKQNVETAQKVKKAHSIPSQGKGGIVII